MNLANTLNTLNTCPLQNTIDLIFEDPLYCIRALRNYITDDKKIDKHTLEIMRSNIYIEMLSKDHSNVIEITNELQIMFECNPVKTIQLFSNMPSSLQKTLFNKCHIIVKPN